MSKQEQIIKCIYCLEMKQSSKEHVMPRSLGGNLTIPWVCQDCNNGMSELDQSLCDSSMLTLSRVLEQPDASIGNSTRVDSSRNTEVRVGHKFKSTSKAQLSFQEKSQDAYTIYGSAENPDLYKKLFSILRKMKQKGTLESIPILAILLESADDKEPKLVLNKSNQLAIRTSSNKEEAKAEHAKIISLIYKKIDEIESMVLEEALNAPLVKIDNPTVIINLAVHFGKNHRAVSKIAFNFLASTFGPDLLYKNEFNDLRDYILHGKNSENKGSFWDIGEGENLNMAATRYSIWVKNYFDQPCTLSVPENHLITLAPFPDRILAIVEFYNQQAFYIDLGKIEECRLKPFPIVHEFNYIKRTNKSLNFEQAFERLAPKLFHPK